MLELDTPHGPARAHLHPAAEARGALVLGHGAGGRTDGGKGDSSRRETWIVAGDGRVVARLEDPARAADEGSPRDADED